MVTGKHWLDFHLETFVRPVLKTIPNINLKDYQVYPWTPKANGLEALTLTWKQAKKNAAGRTILLAGRDVWEFEILARLEGYPTVFRPDISKVVANFLGPIEEYRYLYLIDTGYAGSVPQVLGIHNWGLIQLNYHVPKKQDNKGIYLPPTPEQRINYQIFPENPPEVASLSSVLENNPKYWQSGTIRDGRYHQPLSRTISFPKDLSPFAKASMITRLIAGGTN